MNAGDSPLPPDGAYMRAYDETFARARAALAQDDLRPLARAFADDGCPPPRVTWNPAPDQIGEATLRGALDRWNALHGGLGLPNWRALHAEELGIDMVHLSVVDPVDGGGDFRFALYGSAVAGKAQRDYRGETVREMALRVRTPGPLFYHAVYSIAFERRIAAATWSAAPPWQPVVAWNRLVLPFAFGGGTTGIRFLVAMKPDGTREVSGDVRRAAEKRLN
jgi:hypothetical protein